MSKFFLNSSAIKTEPLEIGENDAKISRRSAANRKSPRLTGNVEDEDFEEKTSRSSRSVVASQKNIKTESATLSGARERAQHVATNDKEKALKVKHDGKPDLIGSNMDQLTDSGELTSHVNTKLPTKRTRANKLIPHVKKTDANGERGEELNVKVKKEVLQRTVKKEEPNDWQAQLANIRVMRQGRDAAVDTMGCDKIYDESAEPAVSLPYPFSISS